ncbi:hypothetical protein N431DRAFT_474361 [Stipitochalara longipes BDJ]|nr:hypothetical protein N431DRAFT_474361 [Stipitochalara longipes BDJ]
MDSKLPLLGSDGTNEQDEYCQKPAISSQQSRLISGLKLALYLSGVLNFMLGLQCLYLIRRGPIREGTLYAGLTRNVPIPWTVYSESNEWNNSAAIDQEWDELHVDDLGIIALPDTYVERMSLPPARRFPWDETKGSTVMRKSASWFHPASPKTKPTQLVKEVDAVSMASKSTLSSMVGLIKDPVKKKLPFSHREQRSRKDTKAATTAVTIKEGQRTRESEQLPKYDATKEMGAAFFYLASTK